MIPADPLKPHTAHISYLDSVSGALGSPILGFHSTHSPNCQHTTNNSNKLSKAFHKHPTKIRAFSPTHQFINNRGLILFGNVWMMAQKLTHFYQSKYCHAAVA